LRRLAISGESGSIWAGSTSPRDATTMRIVNSTPPARSSTSSPGIYLKVRCARTSFSAHSRCFRRPIRLSPREIEVLTLLSQGSTDQEIADALAIRHRTVTTHVTNIFNKLGVNTRTAAASLAIRRDLV
jgi:DNA-binding NarL/FixJ family response regulator